MSRLIENCFEWERLENMKFQPWISVLVPKDSMMIVVDPYIVNIQDLVRLKPGTVGIVRIRRPGWGNIDVRKVLHIIGGN